jgi:hypothetical protein
VQNLLAFVIWQGSRPLMIWRKSLLFFWHTEEIVTSLIG